MLIYLSRSDNPLVLDLPEGCVCHVYPVNFVGVSPRRMLTLAKFQQWLRKKLFEEVRREADCYCDTFDLMFVAMVAARGRRLSHRFEACDIHALVGTGWYAAAQQTCEQLLPESCFQEHDHSIRAAVLE